MTDVLALSLATLRHQARRYLAPGLAVILGVAFIASTLALTSSLTSSVRDSVAGQYASYGAVVTTEGEGGSVPEAEAARVADIDGVTSVDAIRTGGALIRSSTGQRYAMVTNEAAATPHPLLEGRAPRGPDEVSLSRAAAAQSNLEIGDTVPFVGVDGTTSATSSATVVGLVDVGDDPRFAGGTAAVFATPAGVTRLTGATGWEEIGVVADGTQSEIASRVARALPSTDGVVVRTATDHADVRVTALTGGTDMLGAFFLAFAVIALFVSAIVIANTFAILLARRARETAMLRAIGSTRGQVISSALVEAVVVGLVFSVLGVVAGLGMARGLIALGNTYGGDALPPLTLDVPLSAVAVPVVVGVLVVLVAAVRPVLRSSRVAPLEALRPDAAVTVRSRAGALRIGTGLVLGVLGAVALVVSATAHSVPVGVLGGLLSFTGVLMAGSVLVPLLARGIGVVAARPFGAAGRLAVDNAVRNPARASATASALIVGVTLVAMTAVGAATTKSAVTELIDGQYPIDLVVQADEVPARAADALDEVKGVAAAARVPAAQVRVSDASVASTQVAALPADVDRVLRHPSALPDVAPGRVLVSPETADEAGLADGDRLTLSGADGREQLTVTVDEGAATSWLVAPEVLTRLDGHAATGAVYLRLDDGADVDASLDAVREVAAGIDGSEVAGAAPVREANTNALDMALSVVLALLAISVVIAIVGIANTLSLSVLERTRESALMRALGLTRGQLRAMLAIEAALLAAVGVLLGTALGTVYALAGVSALLGEFSSIKPVLPWAQLVAITAAAVMAGLLASVLPARRAARVSPAAALAVE